MVGSGEPADDPGRLTGTCSSKKALFNRSKDATSSTATAAQTQRARQRFGSFTSLPGSSTCHEHVHPSRDQGRAGRRARLYDHQRLRRDERQVERAQPQLRGGGRLQHRGEGRRHLWNVVRRREQKGIFSLMNYWLPLRDHVGYLAPRTLGKRGLGLVLRAERTGKTTLSADPARYLIGDDEHGWDDDGVFNFEGGATRKPSTFRRRPSRKFTGPFKGRDARECSHRRGLAPQMF